jgi:thiosulfate/3-mercaptopyruvate sulfurtransferase
MPASASTAAAHTAVREEDMAGYAHPEYLVETDWLNDHLEDPGLRIYDCTTHLIPDPDKVYAVKSGEEDYLAGHIPGSGYLDLQGELSERSSDLRFTLPSPEQFAAAVSAKGLGDGCRVVLYSTGTAWWATRIWWMLRTFGFDNAAVLNGGWQKWTAEGRPVSQAPATYPPATFSPRPRMQLIADKARVLAAIDDAGTVVINALTERQHRGESGTHYGRPGRIAGSVCVPALEIVNRETNTFLDADALAARFEAAGAGPGKAVINYCGGGIAASATSFALALIGREDVALYDNSLSEWVRDDALPMQTG